jgi:hypothetical protein
LRAPAAAQLRKRRRARLRARRIGRCGAEPGVHARIDLRAVLDQNVARCVPVTGPSYPSRVQRLNLAHELPRCNRGMETAPKSTS